ncbi:MAG: nucleotide pyrophosphohydrolase [Gammaproteobacteria bacterium]|nr:nucleotide pyrophosphohydrolase [Gammaproteobacteria bacterium]
MANKPPQTDSLEQLRQQLAEFAAVRDWDRFHSPKNLAMALIAEAAEVIEHLQWLTQAESAGLPEEKRHAVSHELADILIYLIRLSDKLGVNLIRAAHEKIAINESRYPAARVKGDARRANEYTSHG